AAAQQAPSQPPAAAPATPTASVPVEFSGLLFPQFVYGGAKGNGTRSANQFQIERAYLTAKAKIGDRTTLRLTSDIYRPGGNNGYTMRAKYAYVQYDYWTNGEGFMGTNAQVRLGMQQTVLNETEEAFWPRYVAKIAAERAGFFSSADLGASTTLTFPNAMGELFAEVANGPGYATPENDRFKDYSARLTLTPFGGTMAQGLVLAPWFYKGTVQSALRPAEGRKRDRAGIFAGYKAPAFMLGGDYEVSTNENERNTPAGVVTEDRSGKVLSAYTHLKPLAMMSPTGSKAWGVLLRWDQVSGDNGYLPNNGDFPAVKGKFIVAGITHDVNSKLSWALDWQQQSPEGAAAPALDVRTYNLHVSAAF
ncbi:MAG TPA: hypothetical protein VG432_14060, partial [Gemmatimonadaceae bacterium]|nr:hypothetical protein [Gemmatimonadaceae bacterium]